MRESWVRNVVASGAAVAFGLAILVMSLLAVANPMRVYPQVIKGTPVLAGASVEYYLPYPGVLPDNKLYVLKMVRDRVRLWLTFGDEQKAQRELGYADKRLGAAAALVEGGKSELGIRTYTKAEKYLERAVYAVIRLSRVDKKDVKRSLLTLSKATAKHAEVGVEIAARADREGEKMVALQTVAATQALKEKVDQALLEAE